MKLLSFKNLNFSVCHFLSGSMTYVKLGKIHNDNRRQRVPQFTFLERD